MDSWLSHFKVNPFSALRSSKNKAICFYLAHAGNGALSEETIREIITIDLKGITNQ